MDPPVDLMSTDVYHALLTRLRSCSYLLGSVHITSRQAPQHQYWQPQAPSPRICGSLSQGRCSKPQKPGPACLCLWCHQAWWWCLGVIPEPCGRDVWKCIQGLVCLMDGLMTTTPCQLLPNPVRSIPTDIITSLPFEGGTCQWVIWRRLRKHPILQRKQLQRVAVVPAYSYVSIPRIAIVYMNNIVESSWSLIEWSRCRSTIEW